MNAEQRIPEHHRDVGISANGTAPSNYGGTFGLGVEAHAWKLKTALVIRYTHWAGEGLYEPHTKRNQVEALVGMRTKGQEAGAAQPPAMRPAPSPGRACPRQLKIFSWRFGEL